MQKPAAAATLLIGLLLILTTRPLYAQTQQAAIAASSPRAETVLSKSVLFITVKAQKDGQPVSLTGTGFLVAIRESRLLNNQAFSYLVTNRHVADAIVQDEQHGCIKLPIQWTLVRLNLKVPVNGDRWRELPIPLSERLHWYFPQDEAVDLAVIPFAPDESFDFTQIDSETFFTPDLFEKYRIVPGDKVLTTGFFYHYAGLHQVQPITREGVLAMVPDGPITTTTCRSGSVYLADVHVTAGSSGSPLFLAPALTLGGLVSSSSGGLPYGLLGVVSGYMYEDSDLTLRASTTWQGSLHANSGISVVVPAEQLKALLFSAELKRSRDQYFQTLPKKNP